MSVIVYTGFTAWGLWFLLKYWKVKTQCSHCKGYLYRLSKDSQGSSLGLLLLKLFMNDVGDMQQPITLHLLSTKHFLPGLVHLLFRTLFSLFHYSLQNANLFSYCKKYFETNTNRDEYRMSVRDVNAALLRPSYYLRLIKYSSERIINLLRPTNNLNDRCWLSQVERALHHCLPRHQLAVVSFNWGYDFYQINYGLPDGFVLSQSYRVRELGVISSLPLNIIALSLEPTHLWTSNYRKRL